jgi:outer membrane beta-barrel protein
MRRLSLVLALLFVGGAFEAPDVWAEKPKKRRKKREKAEPKVEEVTPPDPQPAADQPTPEVEIEVSPDQPPPGDVPAEPPAEELDITPPEAAAEAEKPADPAEKKLELGVQRVSWKDIVVVKRKPFLKMSRLELKPSIGITLNDNMIQHYMGNAALTYWLTDVLGVGVEGQYFQQQLLEPYDLIGRQYRRLPTLNKYNWGGALNFHYVPIYAKFAMFNRAIVHWEIIFTAGVGVTQSEVLPRNPALPGWTNILITPNIGLTSRVFLTRWLTLDLGVKDYIFVDKFEDVMRTTANIEDAKDNADSRLINHIMFTAGITFWIPPGFKYTTFR